MTKRSKVLIVGASAVALAAGGAGVAVATGGGEDAAEGPDVALNGSDLDKAGAAALAHTGEGSVSGTEVGDEESYYEVEVTLDDGSQVDVQLDRAFDVVSDEADNDSSEDGE